MASFLHHGAAPASPPLAEIKQKSLSFKSLLVWEEWLAPGSQQPRREQGRGEPWPCHQPGDTFLVPFGGRGSVTDPKTEMWHKWAWMGQAGGLPLPTSPCKAPTNAPLQVAIHCPPSLSQKTQLWALGCRRDSSGKEYLHFFNNLFL